MKGFALKTKKGDFLVDRATNCPEAIEALKTTDFDMVPMDLILLVMNRRETSSEINIRNKSKYQSLPSIVLTAGHFNLVNESNFTDFIFKPYSAQKIQSKIIELLLVR